MTRELTEHDLHYLRSILRQLRALRSFLDNGPIPMPSLPGEALADNIDWLDCFIAVRVAEPAHPDVTPSAIVGATRESKGHGR